MRAPETKKMIHIPHYQKKYIYEGEVPVIPVRKINSPILDNNLLLNNGKIKLK